MLKSKGGSKGNAGPADKKQTIMAVVAIVIILGVGAFFAKSFIGGDGEDSYSVDSSMPGDGSSAMPPPPGAQMPGVPPADPSAQPTPSPEASASPAQPTATSAPAPDPAATPAASTKPAVSAAPTKQIKVFGKINVTYPSAWQIDASVANHAAVFTNGTGFFEIRTPDTKADSAKAIAEAALKIYTPGSVITAQGADKVAGNDAYWFAVSVGGHTARVVGVDASTRVVLIARAPKGVYSAYRDKFDSIQKSLAF